MNACAMLSGFCLLLIFPGPSQGSESMMSIAEAEYEIVMLLIKQQSYKEALEECTKLFSIELPAHEQQRFLDSARTISAALMRKGKPQHALKVIDEAIRGVENNQVLAGLYKEKAFIHKQMGHDEEAVKLFKKAIELEKPAGQTP